MKDYSILKRLEQSQGKQYWRTLDELADTPEFRDLISREFPSEAPSLLDAFSRRNFLKMMGASLAFGGLTGCRSRVDERIFPYAKNPPEEVIPGRPLFFATAMTLGGYGIPLLVESHEGRPTKIEGNPEHPASLGGTDIYAQASVLTMYDPDRSQTVIHGSDITSWSAFSTELAQRLEKMKGDGGSGLRIISERIGSPTLEAQYAELLKTFPKAKWVQYEAAFPEGAREGAKMVFGRYLDSIYRVQDADVIVSLDGDFLSCLTGGLKYARDFSNRRRAHEDASRMNRLYVAEPISSSTGSTADNRIPVRASEIEGLARALAAAIGVPGVKQDATQKTAWWVAAAAKDLQAHKGRSLVVTGDHQPAAVHAVVHAINSSLGNIGKTVFQVEPIGGASENQLVALKALTEDMAAGKVDTLLVLGGNPVFTAPVDLKFADAMKRVPFRAHLGMFVDETSEQCHWHLPEAHYLEAWSDVRCHDGTVSIVQPLIAPLYEGRSKHELLALVIGPATATGYEIVQGYWKKKMPGANFDKAWQTALHDGFFADSQAKPFTGATVNTSALAKAPASVGNEMEIVFRPDPCLYDGRFANNGWLQELPNPFTKLTWDNAALMSPGTAAKLDVTDTDLVEVELKGKKMHLPVLRLPGVAENSITVHYGHGRTRSGKVGTGTGFNAYPLRTSEAMLFATGVRVSKLGKTYKLGITQGHFSMENRHLVRSGTLETYKKNPNFAQIESENEGDTSMYPKWKYEGYAWGMSIDTSVCINCNACMVACQAENNVPVVGKDQVLVSREMHWLRVDTYYEGDPESPKIYNQPIPCMQCENAPCEPVCPVHATTHSSEGLNDMTYNRCVGTRFCQNYCPYKVRRFNFLSYADWHTDILKGLRNPDVTVRERGVLEKCTYCVQRINNVKIIAEREDRTVQDGEIKTACQAACPTEAIIFGDINDKNSKVSKLKAKSVNYALLADLNTKPRTTYLATIRNPNPDAPGANVGEGDTDNASPEAQATVLISSDVKKV
jgi:molybdopterin-containing oxidoreductase family iron-sulfur binding subunit